MTHLHDDVNPICRFCAAIFPIRKDQSGDIPYHDTIADLQAALDGAACALCDTILGVCQAISAESSTAMTAETGVRLQLEDADEDSDNGIGWATLQIGIEDEASSCDTKCSGLVSYVNKNSSSAPSLWRRRGSLSLIPERHDLVKAWMQECIDTHVHCQIGATAEPAVLPKRLVRISGYTDYPAARLVLSQEEALNGAGLRYAALSHCWGSRQPLMTTKSTLQQFSRGLPGGHDNGENTPKESDACHLPKTFHEAIDLCRFLGISYIWIDSLCIVQDDEDEWRSEAAHMKDIYANASLTIAASSAQDSSWGCFISHESIEDSPERCYNSDQVSRYSFLVDTSVREAVDSDTQPYSTEPDRHLVNVRLYHGMLQSRTVKSVLSTRGWTLQEHVLSRRVLHCLYPELHWQCNSVYRTEAGAILRQLSPWSVTWSRLLLCGPLGGPIPSLSHPDVHALCQSWLSDYSRRNSTVSQDWLAALTGIVQKVTSLTGYTHVLGCWEETICQDLCWVGQHTCQASSEPCASVSGIPSWSWISRLKNVEVDGRSSLPGEDRRLTLEDRANLLGRQIIWESLPLVSPLLRAELLLQGLVADLQLNTTHEDLPPILSIEGRQVYGSVARHLDCASVGLDLGSHREISNPRGTYTCFLLRSGCIRPHYPLTVQTFLLLEPVVVPGDQTFPLDYLDSDQCFDPTPVLYRRIGIQTIHRYRAQRVPDPFSGAEARVIRLI
ncbi:heterokaryon incompatibility protein-domain-containing protein [Microdochium trichocladiopsis]|uniref:Heterokaryon incompatibility protein-domain-containing protein n=1 Tax=Microdochium trichocladiopsis TaxID=1682393 RepID=A0A9P9BM27_9PEZI|nr:heterokaryon incompatibility protein-domain-containing protein [Microdochium trichocladiopsis]KAH7014657.1 heterokaryon incompatibility protein-domain-containing protein [Microdochium trichocladiopsis]